MIVGFCLPLGNILLKLIYLVRAMYRCYCQPPTLRGQVLMSFGDFMNLINMNKTGLNSVLFRSHT